MTTNEDLEAIRKERDASCKDFERKSEKLRVDLEDFLKLFNEKLSVIKEMISRLH